MYTQAAKQEKKYNILSDRGEDACVVWCVGFCYLGIEEYAKEYWGCPLLVLALCVSLVPCASAHLGGVRLSHAKIGSCARS